MGMNTELLKKYEENSIRETISDKIFEEGYTQYIQGNFEAAEQRFLETYSMNKDYIGVRNNLAYMKRRGEGRKINISPFGHVRKSGQRRRAIFILYNVEIQHSQE